MRTRSTFSATRVAGRLPLRLSRALALLATAGLALGCISATVDPQYDRVWAAAELVMLTNGPWTPEFREERTIFLRPGTGMYFRGDRAPVTWGHGDGWDWEAYSLGKDESGTEVWFWSNTHFDGTRKAETPDRVDWGLTVVTHGDETSTLTLERAIPEFEMPPRALRDHSTDQPFIRIVSEAPEGKPYWDDAVIVWTRRGRAVQQAEKPFQAARVRRDPESRQTVISRIEISLGEVIGNPDWQGGRRVRF